LSNACTLARSFVAAGFSAIIDEIIHGDRFDELVDGLAGEPFTFVMLHRSYDELRATWRNMGSPFADAWEWVSEEIDCATPRVGLWLDNGELGVQATVDRIVEELRRS
jgi:hypothetical protein